jgi:hypothetical protein
VVVPAVMPTPDGRTVLARAGLRGTDTDPFGDCCPSAIDDTGDFGLGQQGVRNKTAAWFRLGGPVQQEVFEMWNQDHPFADLEACATYTEKSGNWFKAGQIHAAAHALEHDIVVSTGDLNPLTMYSQQGTSRQMYPADYVSNPKHLVILLEDDCHFSGTEQTVPAHDPQHYCCYACS